jgi:hypothetical protein
MGVSSMSSFGSKSAKLVRKFRLEVMRLEDRYVPGGLFDAALFWAMGPLTYPALLAQETSTPDQTDTTVASPALCRVIYPNVENDASLVNPYPTDGTEAGSSGGAVLGSPAKSQASAVFSTGAGDAGALGGSVLDLGNTFNAVADALSSDAHAADGGSGGMTGSTTTGESSGGAALPIPGAPASALQSTPVFNQTITSGLPAANTGGSALMVGPSPQAQAAPAASDASGGTASPELFYHHVQAPNSHGIHPLTGGGPYSPPQISTAYGFNLISNQGSGQTIYIVDAYNDPNIASDLKTFDSQWGLPNPTLTVHKMSRFIFNSVSWGVEESLDVEWAHAMAPKANITLVEATGAYTSALYSAVDWATNNGAHIVSMSWGGGDGSSDSGSDSHFNHTGVTYIASAGDSGGVVDYPSASPYVLSVGGTSLTLNSNNTYAGESAWTSGGGGASVGESEPGYQTRHHITLSGRGTPDVAYDADPNTGVYVYDSYISQPGWYEVGGTSAGAPQWASIIALVNQSRSSPLSSNNLTSRTEYNAATGSIYASNYHDVTTGSNGYAAGTDYDLATGLGSPQVNNLVPWMISNS